MKLYTQSEILSNEMHFGFIKRNFRIGYADKVFDTENYFSRLKKKGNELKSEDHQKSDNNSDPES